MRTQDYILTKSKKNIYRECDVSRTFCIYNSERRKGSQILILLNKGDNYGKH